ncbi:hypothetical protein ULMS_01930 [Patiriisocius marinistellae]|uniref:Uncharacterized protein n=1 Tax=Patiriisocius marinistellae TaxID=2494560 RepID=A0A5J4FXB3_9FLAO|nr:hypothetical protein [Patiriisocius marinistellae]GEQ84685.1 hypothetical protein ULMS_01930 [Patiriisocius marinistellae]
MPKANNKPTRPISALICSIMGHNYIITNKITNHINEYKCTNCKNEVCDNTKGHLEELTLKQREVNETLSVFFKKKSKRQLTA